MNKKKQEKVAKVMREYKAGKLHSGKNGKIVKKRKQAVAIALSQAGLQKEGITDLITDILSEMIEEKKKHNLDPVGKENHDVDNDGDIDSSDEYLKKRREAVSHAMKKHYRKGKKRMDENVGGPVPAVEALHKMIGGGGKLPVFDPMAGGYEPPIKKITSLQDHLERIRKLMATGKEPSSGELEDTVFARLWDQRRSI